MLTNRSGIQEWFVRPKLHVPRRHRELHSEKHLVKKMAMNPASWNAYSVSNQGVWSLKLFAWRVVICFHSSWGICAFGAILLQPEPLVSNRHVIQTLRLRKKHFMELCPGLQIRFTPHTSFESSRSLVTCKESMSECTMASSTKMAWAGSKDTWTLTVPMLPPKTCMKIFYVFCVWWRLDLGA